MPNINSSSLALRRKRLGYEQKQIAMLLGYRTTYQVSRYETGQRFPGFREAVKLSLLYGLPLSVLFERYFEHCREELENSIRNCNLKGKIDLQRGGELDYCSYLERLNAGRVDVQSGDKVQHHIKTLIEERSIKILKDR